MSSASVEFWFDFASTYSYVAAMRVEETARAARAPLVWKPFLLGPLFKRQGWSDSPFNLNPVRGKYMWRDIQRLCETHGLAFKKPAQFPRNSLLAARVACAAAGEPWMPDFARAVFRANFAEDRDISQEAVVVEILAGLQQDGKRWVGRAIEPEIKEALRRETERAWSLGIFGAPSFVVEGELFWGGDRMEQALTWHREAGKLHGTVA
jgi:2-hydroxychromene-2-carboxylate isomerase